MARTIGIIGLGHVGITTAFNMITKGIADTLVIFDKDEDLAEAESYDLTDALGGLSTYTKIIHNDYAALKDADVVVFCAGDISAILGGDRTSEIRTTKQAIVEVLPQLKASGFHGVLIDISNPCDVATTYWSENLGLPQNQIIGTGTALDTYRMRRAVAKVVNVNVADVRGFNMGEHGESQFTAWSTVRVNNKPITEIKTLDLDALSEAARLGGWKIFNKKHYTAFGIATIAMELTEAICSDAKRIFPVSCFDPDYGVCVGHPATIGAQGVVDNPPMALTAAEKAKYDATAKTIQHNLATMKATEVQA
ncbi:Enzyme with possible activities of L-2-hydroxyisocaproate malate lactate dehydrogenase [Agrilactobacillus composti DSM 18527 = JCM 14202]|uniref:Enzyme with possible activities of L-2-hydroxyisocaproate malate lactate dehydrogenase n=1 Tax=Agrilactobacillus composti DSM 18527 = JCM 14202 TaxID=1423734 RepID=X0PNT7_9LACO|nr:L-2-hydroxyisocaproate dehydrogenase [Agrilactobacillus composti]KRM33062.1 Enzyme with possible activities of L-2-hydroxyisocaproate malate lactate dehydrogenase [Agrilactobacillus composti DSM 18527 = JCM 14202]GAF38591.1 L-lactate dehydrogenase [Agrilactobacillus composti DSM 18527 = JCM 14202]